MREGRGGEKVHFTLNLYFSNAGKYRMANLTAILGFKTVGKRC